METDGLDYKAMDDQIGCTPDNFEFIYKKKSRTVNLCPYCRAVLAAILMLPFVYLWRLFPHKPKPKKTHTQIMKSLRYKGLIARGIGCGVNVALGINNIISADNDTTLFTGIFQIGLGIVLVTGHLWAIQIIRWLIEHSPKINFKLKSRKKETKPKKQFMFVKKLHEKHDVICPPIFFVEEHKSESHR